MVKFEPYFLYWWTGLYFVNFMINSNYISVPNKKARNRAKTQPSFWGKFWL